MNELTKSVEQQLLFFKKFVNKGPLTIYLEMNRLL